MLFVNNIKYVIFLFFNNNFKLILISKDVGTYLLI